MWFRGRKGGGGGLGAWQAHCAGCANAEDGRWRGHVSGQNACRTRLLGRDCPRVEQASWAIRGRMHGQVMGAHEEKDLQALLRV